ncbi:MAG: formate dehydrogenase subunit alpha [Desulfococcaceae bacterium]
MDADNTIIINGNEFPFSPGETILQVARKNSIDIPTLCHLKNASPTGQCRVCVVEVKGARSLVASCAAPAGKGMQVLTESPKVVEARRLILQLLLSSGNHNCAVRVADDQDWTQFQLEVNKYDKTDEMCPVWGECELQHLAYKYQVSAERFPRTDVNYPMEDVNPFIVRDFSRCIKCGRCVQACCDVQVNNAISFGFRGTATKVIAAGDRPYKDSDCVFCGECLQACPVGALVEKDARYDVRPWETKKTRTTCTYCGVGCQIHLHTKNGKVIKVTGVEDVAPNYGSLCVKGRFGYDFINSPERLTKPLIKENGEFKEASWDEALDRVAQNLGRIQKAHGGDSIGVLSSARISNEENYVANKYTRAVLKTNNIDHCTRLCHSATEAGLTAAFGSGAMTNTIGDIETADVILITGSNTTENHPVISSFVKRAVKFKGTRLIVVDPRRIHMTRFAHQWLRPDPGTDVVWINGLMHVIIKENLHDKEFVKNRTKGFEDLKKTVEKFTPEYVEEITGIPAAQIEGAARMFASAQAGSILYCMGITQHITGTDNVKSLANLAMLCGNMGIEGGGVNPLRGQNNLQGACDMGILPDVYPGYQPVTSADAKKKMEEAWGVTGLSDKVGLKMTEMIPKADSGELKALYIIGENPLISDPDLNQLDKSIANLDFLVVQDIFLTETARKADVVLPSLCFAEKDGTFTNTERRVQRIRKAVDGPAGVKTDWEIICEIATRMGYEMKYENSEAIMAEIAAVTPSYGGITYDRIAYEGIQWPCPDTEHPGTPILHKDQFPIGLGNFHAIDYIPPAEPTDEEYPLKLTTGQVLYQYRTGTMTRKSAGLNFKAPESFVEISTADARAYGIQNGDMVEMASRRGSILVRVKVSTKAVNGTVFIPVHYAEAAANKLTNAAVDPVSGTPEYKVCAVKLSKAA